MGAARYDLLIKQGETLRRVIRYRDPTGADVDLTGARVRWQIRKSVDADPPLLDFDSANLVSGMTIGALDDTGTIDFTVSGAITGALSFTTAKWDLLVISAGGEDDYLLEGNANLDRAITR